MIIKLSVGTTVTASNDVIYVTNSQPPINWTLIGSGDTIFAANSIFQIGANDTETIFGSTTITLGNNDNINDSGDTLKVGANYSETINGIATTINAASGDTLKLGRIDTVNITDGTLNVLANSIVYLNGANNIVNASTSDTIHLLAGSGTTVTASNDVIYVTNSQPPIKWTLIGSGDTIFAANSIFQIGASDTETIFGSGATIDLSSNDKITALGNTIFNYTSFTDSQQSSHDTLTNFAPSNDKINFSPAGNFGFATDIHNFATVNLAHSATDTTLASAIADALTVLGTGSTANKLREFQYGGNTYILGTTATETTTGTTLNNDLVIQLTGNLTLTSNNFSTLAL